MKDRTLVLSEAEYQQLRVTLEDVIEEGQELASTLSWYASALPERAEVCLAIVERAT